jgi:hypothetical protein
MTKTREIDLRLIVEDDIPIETLIHSIGMGMECVHEIVQLENDGFAHLMPVESTREKFVDD